MRASLDQRKLQYLAIVVPTGEFHHTPVPPSTKQHLQEGLRRRRRRYPDESLDFSRYTEGSGREVLPTPFKKVDGARKRHHIIAGWTREGFRPTPHTHNPGPTGGSTTPTAHQPAPPQSRGHHRRLSTADAARPAEPNETTADRDQEHHSHVGGDNLHWNKP